VYDDTGRPAISLEHDFRGLTPVQRVASVESEDNGGVGGAFRRAISRVSSIVSPKPLEAAPVFQEDCTAETTAFLAAQAAVIFTYANLAAKIAACAFTGGIVCPAVVTATAAAAAAMLAANALLDDCYSPGNPALPNQGSGVGDYTGGCYWIDWYISYDNGATWEYLDTEYYC
jgi:hypothetical protein